MESKLIGVDVFLEKRKTRMYVGRLIREGETFVFTYDDHYLWARHVIPLGPEFPLTAKEFKSAKLFPSLQDRIPSRQNPAYPEYCHQMGIDPGETNQLVLLSTIGRRGPSSFIFAPAYDRSLSSQQVIEFRQALGLTTREFAFIFELTQSSLNALERDRTSGKEILKRLELIMRFPSVALQFLTWNGGILQRSKHVVASAVLKNRVRTSAQ